MDIFHIVLRVVVLLLSLPFGFLAAVIPGYAAGRLVSMIGLPEAVGRYPVGLLTLILFVAYFQDKITPPFQSTRPRARGRRQKIK